MKGAPKPVASILLTLINTAVLQCQAGGGNCRKGDITSGQEKDSSLKFSVSIKIKINMRCYNFGFTVNCSGERRGYFLF